MLGLDTLDVLIGVVFVFLLVSLMASAAVEIFEAIRKRRARFLWEVIGELLRDPKLVEALYNHPLINGLYKGNYQAGGKDLPSYIPSRSFALAVMDLLLGEGGATGAAAPPLTATTIDPAKVAALSAAPAAAAAAAAAGPIDRFANQAREAVLALVNAAQNDAAAARKNIEDWYNTAMDRVSGWYKRNTHAWLLLIGFILAVAMNVNTVRIVRELATSKPKRDAVVGIAVEYAKSNPPAGASTTDDLETARNHYRDVKDELDVLGLPIGWNNYGCPTCTRLRETNKYTDGCWLRCWAGVVGGWLLTALAVSLGAPFWFDMLNKIIVVRSTVKPQEKSGEEAPKEPRKT